MRTLITIMLAVGIVGVASGYDLGNQAPPKSIETYPVNVRNPLLQGGDTIASATVIPGLPYYDSGTTVGYVDDYAGTCLYDADAPDVVYVYTVEPGVSGLDISLCGSAYDTGLYVYNDSMVEIACNDDYCGLQSELEIVSVTPGETYYIVADGYGSSSGSFVISVEEFEPCVVPCPAIGRPEGEPPLHDDYVDNWNGGCNTPGYPFQDLSYGKSGRCQLIPVLCGVSGWFTFQSVNNRDTDWYILTTGWAGVIEITADAEYATYIFELGPQDCASVDVLQLATAGPCNETMMTIVGPPNTPVWFWVGPTVFAPPPGGENMYDYVVWFTYGYVATEPTTWGTLKVLFQ